jgi:hypothetical protein
MHAPLHLHHLMASLPSMHWQMAHPCAQGFPSYISGRQRLKLPIQVCSPHWCNVEGLVYLH